MISYSNWTEWCTIQGVVMQVIQNRTSTKREADLKLQAQYYSLNCTTQGPITNYIYNKSRN